MAGSTNPSRLDFAGYYCMIGSQYTSPSQLHRYIDPGIIPFPRKVQGIRNDDQSLSPLISLVIFYRKVWEVF